MNPHLFGAYLSTVKNGGRRTTSNFMQEHGPSGSVARALGAGIAGAVVNPGRLTRNLVATGLGNAVNQLASPQSALHQGLKTLGTNPGVFSAAGAAALHPSISDEALQHGGYQVPANRAGDGMRTFYPDKATLKAPASPMPPPQHFMSRGVPGTKKSTINPRLFGAYLSSLKSAAAAPAEESDADIQYHNARAMHLGSQPLYNAAGVMDPNARKPFMSREEWNVRQPTPGATASQRPMTEYDRAQVNARLNGGQVRQDIALQGAPAAARPAPQPAAAPPMAQTAPAAAAGLGGRMFNNAARLFTPWPAMLGRAAANKTQQAPASAPPPPQSFMSTGQTGKPTPAAAPKAPASPIPPPQHFLSTGVPGTKKSTINPRIFGAMVAQLR